jgi:hypothetical protein
MEKELAKHVIRAAFQSASRLEDLLPLLKEHCDETEYGEYRMAIAKAIYGIQNELLKKAFSAHPQLEVEIESDINKYGRLL